MPGRDRGPGAAGRDPLGRLPRLPARAGASRWPTDDAADVPRRRASPTPSSWRCPSGYPPIYGEIQGPPGSPVVMLYAHYDVQPAPPEQGWTSDPWTATRKDDGRIYGRGAADDKGGLASTSARMRVFDGKPPCTVKLILEGMEETESNLEAFVDAHPELFDVRPVRHLRHGQPAGRRAGADHRAARATSPAS